MLFLPDYFCFMSESLNGSQQFNVIIGRSFLCLILCTYAKTLKLPGSEKVKGYFVIITFCISGRGNVLGPVCLSVGVGAGGGFVEATLCTTSTGHSYIVHYVIVYNLNSAEKI